MGQTLSEPVTAKHTSNCHSNKYKVGSSCMQGWRISILFYELIICVINGMCCCFVFLLYSNFNLVLIKLVIYSVGTDICFYSSSPS